MTTGNNYFNPIDQGGLQVFTASGQTGWYQFNVPGALVSTLPGITVPQGAGGMVLQANTSLSFCWSPTEAAAGTTAWFTLAAGDTITLPGPAFIRQFCVRLGLVAGASFSVQFLRGNIGPMLQIFARSSSGGGPTPPPPPGLSAVLTPNVLHVMPAPTGNNTTGAPYRLDLPYATIAAAEAAAQAGDTVMIWAGTYVAANIGFIPGVNFTLVGATLEDNGTDPIFFFNAPACTIDGFGLINSLSASAAIETANSGQLTINVPINAGNIAVRNGGGSEITIRANITGGLTAIDHQTSNRFVVYGNVQGNVVVANPLSECTIYGDVSGQVQPTGSSKLTIIGNITGDVLPANLCQLFVRGNITGQFTALSCTAEVYGRVVGPVTAQNGSLQLVVGDVEGDVTADNSVQSVRGNVTCSDPVSARNNATQTIDGVVTSTGQGAVCDASQQIITGSLVATNTALECNGGGIQRFNGRARSTGQIAAYCSNGTQEVNGTLIADQAFGAQIREGVLRISGRIESCRACVAIEDSTVGYTVVLGAGIVLIANVGGACAAVASVVTLDGNPVNTVCMGVYANLPFEPAVTALVEAPIVSTQVQ